MNKNGILLAAVGGAAIGAAIAYFLYSDQGKEFVSSAGESLKDLTDKATEYAKKNIPGIKNINEVQTS
ncbi:hypothetical protein [Chryseosolibacter indicus]|uniref:YtxH domain-containing protein n=1 Tax=Chryseosolibacter indicus TaxID=2782351 RepID=A0ABS5VX23_9BACT|nr:hypothetical protein [Chryseosolibacter indicus]MBT1705791.1 YtxH domain-containing protein [Chryseosolibacter indicus]